MTWDESKHPRNEVGEFTFKNERGNTDSIQKSYTQAPFKLGAQTDTIKESLADNLYGDEQIRKEVEAKLSDYKSKLFNILGNLTTRADVLYSDIQEIEDKIIKNGLKDKLDKLKQGIGKEFKNTMDIALNSKLAQYAIRKMIGKNYNQFFDDLAKFTSGKDTAGMLDLAHGINMNDRSYIKDAISLDNYNDPKVASDREYLKKKVSEQFKDYNFDINKIKGYNFPENSEPSQRIAQSKDFIEILKKKKKEILERGETSSTFEKHGFVGVLRDSNLHNAIGSFDIRRATFDKEGNLHLKIYDTYDFNAGENGLVRAGREEMKENNLKPYFTIHDIMIPKQKADEIFK